MERFALLFFLSFASLPFIICFATDADTVFYDSFNESFEGRWVVSEKKDYKGVWEHSKSEGHEDYGLLVSEKAKKYAIVSELDEPVNLKDGTTVLQFEARFQEGLECGGSYLKYLRPQVASWRPEEFDNTAPFTIMFGPDRCGVTNKVHFILKHRNPKSGAFIEHHLKHVPIIPYDSFTHVYTAIMKPDNEVIILVDGEEKERANFFTKTDFLPPLIPPKTIPDPDDKKPVDWDERAKIINESAVKPDDWDEDAPMEIEDEEAVKPEGWLDDEPDEVDDPDATKPEDWDDEEDGEWEAPRIDNPACAIAPGCGEWKRPMKRNPAYRGKWSAPLIENPNYKGIWKPRDIPNLDYFEIDKPDFEPIAAIGIEIWTMQRGILFDNILIAKSEEVAESYRKNAWKPKYDAELERGRDGFYKAADGLSGIQKTIFDVLYNIAEIPFLSTFKPQILDLIRKAEKQPTLSIGVLISVVVIILTIFFKLFGGKKQPKVEKKKKKKRAVADTSKELSSGEEEREETANAPRRRRREN